MVVQHFNLKDIEDMGNIRLELVDDQKSILNIELLKRMVRLNFNLP